MPAVDGCEPQVIRAFERAGWVVVKRPYDIRLEPRQRLYADLALQNADRQIVVVEVKCFADNRPLLDTWYHAIGQYLMYRTALEASGNSYPVYLVIPDPVDRQLQQIPVAQTVINHVKMKLIVVDLEREVITSWLD